MLYTRKIPYALNPQQWLFVRRLRARGVGPVWIYQIDDVSYSLIARAGYDATWCVTHRDYLARLGEHSVDNLVRMTMATPAALSSSHSAVSAQYAPHLCIAEAWREDARAWLASRGLKDRPIVLIQAGNKRTMRLGSRRRKRNEKYWPESNWATRHRSGSCAHARCSDHPARRSIRVRAEPRNPAAYENTRGGQCGGRRSDSPTARAQCASARHDFRGHRSCARRRGRRLPIGRVVRLEASLVPCTSRRRESGRSRDRLACRRRSHARDHAGCRNHCMGTNTALDANRRDRANEQQPEFA